MDTKRPVTSHQRPRFIRSLFLVSLCFNVGFFSYLLFLWQGDLLWVHVEGDRPVFCKKVSDSELQEQIAFLDRLSDSDLFSQLDDSAHISHGYSRQELALSLLRSREYCVEEYLRSIGKWPQPLVPVSWEDSNGQVREISLFSSITLEEVVAVGDFLSKLSVPFTPCGIVDRLSSENRELFIQALVRTDEWAQFCNMFPHLSEDRCVDMAQEIGGLGFLSVIEKSDLERQERVLVLFEKTASKSLAEYLAAECPDYVVARGSDETVIRMLSVLRPQGEPGCRLSLRLLHSPRKSVVWKASQLFLARGLNRPEIASASREELFDLLKQLAGMKRPVVAECKKETPSPQPAPPSPAAQISSRAATRQLTPYKSYIVKKGDTLWSVAKQFNVHVEKLKYLNGLKGTTLSPGATLKIPH